jgi:hypothetical protein
LKIQTSKLKQKKRKTREQQEKHTRELKNSIAGLKKRS